MADIGKIRSALITDCADNTTGLITAQVLRNLIISSMETTVAKTTTYTATLDDSIILCGGTTSYTVTLPAAASSTGKIFTFKKTSAVAYAVTIDANASETIDGSLSRVLTGQYTELKIICDGSNWHIIEPTVRAVTSKTADYTVTTHDEVIICGGTANITMTLPAAAGLAGRLLYFKKTSTSAYTVTIDANASETIDGALTKVLIAQNSKTKLVSDGTNWLVLDSGNAAVVTKTTTYTITGSDNVVLGNHASTPFTITLPTAVGIGGKVFTIKNINLAAVTIDTTSSQTIDGASTVVLSQKWQTVQVMSDDANWIVVGGAN